MLTEGRSFVLSNTTQMLLLREQSMLKMDLTLKEPN